MKAWQRDEPTFLRLLRGLSPEHESVANVDLPWRLKVLFRVALGPPRAHRAVPSFELAALTARTMTPELLKAVVTEAITRKRGGWSPEIKIVRHYQARMVCTDDNFLERVVQDARSLQPFFEWIGEPIGGAPESSS
jgi:hypothetical protein